MLSVVYRTAVEQQQLVALDNLEPEVHRLCVLHATKLRLEKVLCHLVKTYMHVSTYKQLLQGLKARKNSKLYHQLQQIYKLPVSELRDDDLVCYDVSTGVLEWKDAMATHLVKQTQRDGFWYREARTLTSKHELLQNLICQPQFQCLCIRQLQGFRLYQNDQCFVFAHDSPVIEHNSIRPPESVGKCYVRDERGRVALPSDDLVGYPRLTPSYQTFVSHIQNTKYTLVQHGQWLVDKTFHGFWYSPRHHIVTQGTFNQYDLSYGKCVIWDFYNMTKYVGHSEQDQHHGEGKLYELVLPGTTTTVAPAVIHEWCHTIMSDRHGHNLPFRWRLIAAGRWRKGALVQGVERVWDDQGRSVDFDHQGQCLGPTQLRDEMRKACDIVKSLAQHKN